MRRGFIYLENNLSIPLIGLIASNFASFQAVCISQIGLTDHATSSNIVSVSEIIIGMAFYWLVDATYQNGRPCASKSHLPQDFYMELQNHFTYVRLETWIWAVLLGVHPHS